MHRRLSAASVLLVLFAFAAATADAYDQFGSVTFRLYNGTPYYEDQYYCGGWNCHASEGCTVPLRFQLAQFTDTLLPDMKLRSVAIHWTTGNDYRGYSWQNIPTVRLDLNGNVIDTQTIWNLASCGLGAPQTYAFESGDYPAGFPGYVRSGASGTTVNTIYLTLLTTDGAVDIGTGTITLYYELPPPFEFNVTDQSPESDRRVILSNSEPGYSYPHFQSLGARDSEVPMYVRARNNNGLLQAGLPVYLRIADPPDTAPYMSVQSVPVGQRPHANDNNGPAATLDGYGITPVPNISGMWQGLSGANGELDFTLKLAPGTAAGDNYQIEASSDPSFPAAMTQKSGTLTAWKRVFVEKHNTLRNGLPLNEDSPPGASTIHVSDNHYGGNQGKHRISRGDRIVLVHAPAADRRNALVGWYLEEHNVADVVRDANGYVVTLGNGNGNHVTPESLQHSFGVDPSQRTEPSLADWIAKLSGVTLSPADYFDAPDDLVTGSGSPFPAAFTEYLILPNGPFGFVPMPHFGTFLERPLQTFGEKWCVTAAGTAAAPNHQLLVIADDDTTSVSDAGLTITQAGPQTSSWVWRGMIDANVGQQGSNPGGDPNLWAAKTSAHELAHQWTTNTLFNLNDHCPQGTKTYNDPTLYCLMAASDSGAQAQRTNGIARFHILILPGDVVHSEYVAIRRWPDPFVP